MVWYLGYNQFLVIMNKAAILVFRFCVTIPPGWMFNFLKNLANYFPEWLFPLSSYQQGMSDPVSLHPYPHLVLSFFFYFSHSDKFEEISRCGFPLICISLMANDVEQLFMCFWPSVYLIWWKNQFPQKHILLQSSQYEIHDLHIIMTIK